MASPDTETNIKVNIWSAVIDAIKGWVAGLDSLWVWGGAIGTMLYAIFDHKATCNEIREAVGIKKNLLRLKLTMLWLLPTFGFMGAYSNMLSSEQMAEKIGPRTISEDRANGIASCLGRLTNRGTVKILASVQDAEATEFAEQIGAVLIRSGFDVYRPGWTGPRSIAGDAVLFSGFIGASITVNDIHTAPSWAGLIQKCFKEYGISLEGMTDPATRTNEVVIGIGQKP